MARLADQLGGRVAADGARWLLAVEDLAGGDDHSHRVAGPRPLRPQAPGLEVVVDRDLAEGRRIVVAAAVLFFADQLDQSLLHLVALRQAVDQAGLEGGAGEVAAGRGEPGW